MDPVTAAILIGAATSFMANQSAQAQVSAQRKQHDEGVKNENAAVESNFAKKVSGAQGIGGGFKQQSGQPLGNQASQAGGILGDMDKNNVNSILG